jgi:hypothetical protein
MSKKIQSKNDISARGKIKEFLFNGQKIKPVKLITETSTFLAAEYENGDLVLGSAGNPLPWSSARN